MAPWPELLAKQLESYRADRFEWRQVAMHMVFPYLPERLPQFRRQQSEPLPNHDKMPICLKFSIWNLYCDFAISDFIIVRFL